MNRRCISAALCALLVLGMAAKVAAQEPVSMFFTAPGIADSRMPSLSTEAIRSRTVLLNAAALPTPDSLPGERIRLNLFDGVALDVDLEALAIDDGKRYAWSGRVTDDPESSVTLAVVRGVMQVNVHSPLHGEYQVRYAADDTYDVIEIDPSLFPECGVGPEHAVDPAPVRGPLRRALPDPRDATYRVDILVVYTAFARSAVGGKAAMEALIDLAIVESNDAYVFSQIDMELNLVGTFEVDYDESGGFGSALSTLRNNGDGIMDEVHIAREATGADMVSLIINNGASCGIAYVMTSLAGDFSGSAFSVEHYSCATGYYSFAHELGHNMGATHDLANTPNGALYPYSLGWHWGNSSNPGYNGDYRSIMAYSPGARVQRFSNPNVNHSGEPTGSAGVADNAATLNSSASTVAAWRDAAAWIAALPNAGLDTSGPEGGPFPTTSFDFTLTNLDTASANWLASSNQAWASVSSGSGTLPAGGTTTVTVTLGAAINAFDDGVYTASITFTDTTNSRTTIYDITLDVLGPPPAVQYAYTFDSNPGWTTTGDWAFGVPLGFGSINPDPTSGYTGNNVYGYNLAGDYANNMAEETLTTTAIDCSNLENTQLRFRRWLGVESSTYDQARIQVSNNGSSWTNVWVHSGAEIMEVSWSEQTYDISAVADGQATVYIRWVMGTTDGSVTFSGWNIDDVEILGDSLVTASDNIWVDFAYNGAEAGTVGQPFNTLAEALPLVNPGGTLHILAGTTAETATLNTSMTVQAENGTVRIGAP